MLKGIDLDVTEGEVVALIGSSGSGKTTLLRCINMLETFHAGEIHVDGAFLRHLDSLLDRGALPLGGSRYLLLEFDREGDGPHPEDIIHEVAVAGWRGVPLDFPLIQGGDVAGRVAAVLVAPDQNVAVGDPLVEIAS